MFLFTVHASEKMGLCLSVLVYDQGIHYRKKSSTKNNLGFSYSKNVANFEAFRWIISSSINLLFAEECKKMCPLPEQYFSLQATNQYLGLQLAFLVDLFLYLFFRIENKYVLENTLQVCTSD